VARGFVHQSGPVEWAGVHVRADGGTASGAAAVQIVLSCHLGSRDIEHIGSAQDDADLEILKASAQQRLVAGRARLTWAWSAPIQRSGMREGRVSPVTACCIDPPPGRLA